MLFKTEVTASATISGLLKSKVKINKVEFNVVPEKLTTGDYAFHIQDEKGDFEILKIQSPAGYYPSGQSMSAQNIIYDQINKRFTWQQDGTFTFTILTDVEFEKTDKKDSFVEVPFELFVSSEYMKSMKLYEYAEDYIKLPGYKNLKFKRYIKKIKEKFVEIFIENPFEIEIGPVTLNSTVCKGNKDDYKVMVNESGIEQNFCQKLFFLFSLEDLKKFNAQIQKTPNNDVTISTTPALNCTVNLEKPIFYEIMSSTKYADVHLYTSDGTIIPTHRCVLSKYSVIFDKMFEKSKEIPVKVQFEQFDVDTVTAALNFCYGKTDCIQGKASKLLEFANAFAFNELKVYL
uniref:BTB domain-containing protein n=1 Tax=Panagrolaimus sp. PS1159 TaxID=55785 RepID=A0AC35GQ95_9BILA